jgi:hypothetical protein
MGMTRVWAFGVCLLGVLIGGSVAAAAGPFDGKTNLICSAAQVVGCIDGANCLVGPARTFDLPDFMLIDFDKKIVRQARASGDDSVSPIKTLEISGTQLVLQGIENGHGWSMAIHRDHGRMTTVAVGEELSFSIFGACTSL